jgi:hypothetical protein
MSYIYYQNNQYYTYYSHQNISCRLLDICPERNFVDETSKNIYYENNYPFTFYFGTSPSFSYSNGQVVSIVFGSIFIVAGVFGLLAVGIMANPH